MKFQYDPAGVAARSPKFQKKRIRAIRSLGRRCRTTGLPLCSPSSPDAVASLSVSRVGVLRLTLVDRLRAVSVHPDKEVFTEQLSMASTAVEGPVSVITSLCLS